MAFDSPGVDFNYFLQRKYALLQQQADAGTVQAQSGQLQAQTGAITGAADAKLNNVRSSLLPAESASQIGLQGAQTALTRNQSAVVIPTAMSAIGVNDANIASTNVNTQIAYRDGLVERTAANPAGTVPKLPGFAGYAGFRLPAAPIVSPTPVDSYTGLERGVRVRRGSF
jgi:hypothetical protein